MRTITEIKEDIITDFMNSEVLAKAYGFNVGDNFSVHFSPVSIESILFYIFATAAWVVESLFFEHRADVEQLMTKQLAHTLSWYRERALEFMYGKQLMPFTRHYDTTGMTPEDIIAARIVTYAACVRVRREGGRIYLLLKVAKGDSELEPLSAPELEAFKGYIHSIQDAGVDIDCMSAPADRARMRWKIYYDPQIIDAQGNRVDGTAQDVVKSAIKDYLKQLSFNGLYVPTSHVDHLQGVDGIQVPVLQSAEFSVDNGTTWSQSPDDGIIPSAGWCKIYDESDLTIQMIPFNISDNV